MPKQISVLVGTVKGAFFFHSDEGRQEWRVTGPFLSGWEISAFLGDARHGRILAGTCHMAYAATLRSSDDMSETWTELETGPAYSKSDGRFLNRYWQLVPGARSEPDTLYAGVDEGGLFVSRDRGIHWAEVDGLNRHPTRPHWTGTKGGLCLHSILVHPDNSQRLWVAVSDGGVFRTEDGGGKWEACHRGLPRGRDANDESDHPEVVRGVHKIALDPLDPETLYLQHHCGVYQSFDGGQSWFSITQGLPSGFGFPIVVTGQGDLFVAPLEPETRFFLGGRLGLYRRKRDATTWDYVGKGLPDAPHFSGVLRDSLAVDTLEPAGIYFGTTQGDLYFSPDGGETWGTLPGRFSRITSMETFVQ